MNDSILVTVPDLNSTASPYRELMGMAKYVPRYGFNVSVCSLRENGYSESMPMLREMGVECFVHRFRPRNKRVLSLSGYRIARDIVNRMNRPFCIQHSLDFTSSPYEAVLARLNKKYFVFSQRNMNEGGHRKLLKLKTGLADHVVAISDATADLIRGLKTPDEKISVIPLGIDLESVQFVDSPGVRQFGSMLLSVGHLQRRKRHEDAIRAVAELASEYEDLRLAVAGAVIDNEYADELRALVASLGLESRVEFLGPRPDVLELMRQARALVLCSESEAFGWVVVEAMATGLPVIAPNIGGPREIMGDSAAGWLVEPRNIDGYKLAMAEILREPRRAEQVARNARRRIEEKYSAEAMAMNLAKLYESILRKRPAP